MTTSTAADRRYRARSTYNAELADCPGHQVLAILSGKWTPLIVEALAEGPQRHGELARRVAGATQKMLTQTLRELERDGLVTRTMAGEPRAGRLRADPARPGTAGAATPGPRLGPPTRPGDRGGPGRNA